MKIELTPNQYQTLLELAFMGNWIVNTNKQTDTEKAKEYEQLEKLLFSKAKEFDLGVWADEDGCPSRKFEEESPVYDFIEDYDDYTFWDELTLRLAKRDLYKKYGKEALSKMSAIERLAEEDELMEKYLDIFEDNGLEALTLLAPIQF